MLYSVFDHLQEKDRKREIPMSEKRWSDISLLKAIPNPTTEAYEIKIKNPEITFLGSPGQPDYAIIHLSIYPNKKVIELRSLKEYFQQFRNMIISYERLTNVIYQDLKNVYEPIRLRIVMETNPRGGLSSKIIIDSDWLARGGKEQFKDWIGQSDEW